jgi:hypothetical protein
VDSSAYGKIDRLLHRMAFGGIELQKAVADIEDRMYRAALEKITPLPPIFVTSVPRAGTTLLLDAIATLPTCAVHTYRSMPFVLCPLLWRDISHSFRKPNVDQARAHGDGMSVGFDSPEAFEEVLWRAFWPGKYKRDRIELWGADDRDPEFEDFFRRHMRKLVFANPRGGGAGRYVSKNNANIARIPLLRRLFPGCRILIPFRDPFDQAASLLNQHRRFTGLHAQDAFAKYYMESIGHLEFGSAFTPIAFADRPDAGNAADLAFWVDYWTAAFAHLLAQTQDADPNVHLVDFDRLCAQPESSLAAVGEVIGDGGLLKQEAARFHAAVAYAVPDALRFSPAGERAYALYAGLRRRAVNRSP